MVAWGVRLGLRGAAAARVRLVGPQLRRNMFHTDLHHSETYQHLGKIISASLSAVSPPELVSKAVSFEADTNTMTVADQKYHINK